MKFIISLFAASTFAVAASAIAQQFVAPPSSSPEDRPAPRTEATAEATPEAKASDNIVETPTASSSVTETKGKSATTTATEKKAKSASATATEKKEPPAPGAPPPKKSVAAPETKPARKMSVEASLKEMENKWQASIPAHDVTVLQTLLAPDFAGISSKGKFTNKSVLLADLKSDTDVYKSAKNEKLNVRVYGSNVAVVTGTAREKGTSKEGTPFDRTYRFTDTWVERNGQWQCVASQDFVVAGQ